MNKKKLLALILCLFGLLFSQFSDAAIYKCQSADGETIYSSIKCSSSAEIFVPAINNPPSHATPTIDKKTTEKKPHSTPAVDIYITSWCPYCKKAMAYLRSKNIAFNAYDIEKNAQAKAKKIQLSPGYSGIPLTVINGRILKGFSKREFDIALDL